MAQIFISYRREDARYVAGMLSQRLRRTFGDDSVFIDLDAIPLGMDFREYINKAVAECVVLLAIIGDKWLTATDRQHHRRIDDPSDFVRIEIEAAISRNIPIIPILIDNATMPGPDSLPESMHPLAYRNAAELRAGRDMDHHMKRLVHALQRLVGQTSAGDKIPVVDWPKPKDTSPAGHSMASFRFTRDTGWAGMLSAFTLQVDGKVVGKLRVGESLDVSVTPGTHQVRVSGAGTFFDWERELTIEAGQSRAWKVAYTMVGGVKMTEE